MSATQKRRRDVLLVLARRCRRPRSSSRCSPVRWRSSRLQLLADVALAGYVYLLVQYKHRTQEQRSKVRYLGAAYGRTAPSLTRSTHRPLARRADRASCRSGRRRRTSEADRPWIIRARSPLPVAGRAACSSRSTARVRSRCRVAAGDPLVRSAIRAVHAASSAKRARADRGGRRVPRRGGRRARRPPRRALRRASSTTPRRSSPRRNLTLAFVARSCRCPTADELGVDVQPLPQRHGRSRERAASPGARLPARRRARRGRAAARADGRRLRRCSSRSTTPTALTGGLRRTTDALRARCSNAPAATSTTAIVAARLQAAIESAQQVAGLTLGTLTASFGGVAQPGRALRSQRRSRGFKSHHLHSLVAIITTFSLVNAVLYAVRSLGHPERLTRTLGAPECANGTRGLDPRRASNGADRSYVES